MSEKAGKIAPTYSFEGILPPVRENRSRRAETAKVKTIFYCERSHQVIDSTGSGTGTNPNKPNFYPRRTPSRHVARALPQPRSLGLILPLNDTPA